MPATNIRTTRGYPARNGTAGYLYTAPGDFSILIRNKNNVIVFSNLNVLDQITILQTSKADIDSPTFTGIPSAPTAAHGTSTNQLATTAFVLQNIGNDRKNTINIINTIGTTAWICPTVITNIYLTACAAGGKGGDGDATFGGSGGGSAGWCQDLSVAVVPGTSYDIVLSSVADSTMFGLTFGKGGNAANSVGAVGAVGAAGAAPVGGFAGYTGGLGHNNNGGGGGGFGGVGGASSVADGGGGGGGSGSEGLAAGTDPGLGGDSGKFRNGTKGGKGGEVSAGEDAFQGGFCSGAGGGGGGVNFNGGAGNYGGGGGGGGDTVTVGGAGGGPFAIIEW
jgi:hypothetical protein